MGSDFVKHDYSKYPFPIPITQGGNATNALGRRLQSMACSCVGFTQRRTTFEHQKANILQEHVNYSDFYATMIKSLYTGGLPLCWHFDFTKVVMGFGA